LTAIHVLLLVALLEVAINRIAVPMLRPAKGTPPWWHTGLDYVGLFLLYFAGVLAALVIFTRAYQAIVDGPELRWRITHGVAGVAALIAATPLVIATPPELTIVLELAFGAAIVAMIVATIGRHRELGLQIGLPIIAVPLLLHTANAIGSRFIWFDTFDTPSNQLQHAGVVALALAALVSPYAFAPRPFARAVTKPGPVLLAMGCAAIGAIATRMMYPTMAKAAALAIGIELTAGQPDPRLALYLLAVATLVWTLVSCALSPSEGRRQVFAALTLVLCGGYEFHWPHHYLLPLLGFMLAADASRRVRDEELALMPFTHETPPVTDSVWATYIASVVQGLKRTLGDVHSLTTRGDAGLTSSVIVAEVEGLPVRAKIERIEGCVLALDIVVGREIDEVRGATVTLWAIPERSLGLNPAGPPAAPLFKTGDRELDLRFKVRGSALAFNKLFDEDLRSRAMTTLDGWLAYWDAEGLRYRVYPGRGSPLDHPLPLSDLALNRPTNPERLVAVIELLVELGKRGIKHVPVSAPAELDEA
jgi:hypothetical protein